MNMNGREKFLIIVLVAIVILLGGFKLLLEPSLKSLSTAKADYETALDNKARKDLNMTRSQTIYKENDVLEGKVNTVAAPFFPEIKSDMLQGYFKDLLKNANIDFTSFVLTPTQISQISNPAAVNDEIAYPAKDAAESITKINNNQPLPTATPAPSKENAKNAGAKQPADALEMSIANIQFSGSMDQAITFLDGIKSSKRIARVTALTITVDEKGASTIVISIECYGVKKFNDADPLSKSTLN